MFDTTPEVNPKKITIKYLVHVFESLVNTSNLCWLAVLDVKIKDGSLNFEIFPNTAIPNTPNMSTVKEKSPEDASNVELLLIK